MIQVWGQGIKLQGASAALLLSDSICPELWCLTLTGTTFPTLPNSALSTLGRQAQSTHLFDLLSSWVWESSTGCKGNKKRSEKKQREKTNMKEQGSLGARCGTWLLFIDATLKAIQREEGISHPQCLSCRSSGHWSRGEHGGVTGAERQSMSCWDGLCVTILLSPHS